MNERNAADAPDRKVAPAYQPGHASPQVGTTFRSGVSRLALLSVLLVAYGVFFGRNFVSGGAARLDPLGPEARQIERAIAERRFDDAKQLATSLSRRFGSPGDSLLDYWFALIANGRRQPREEAEAWERFIGPGMGAGGAEACPAMADAYAQFEEPPKVVAAYARCAARDPNNPERLIDLGDAYARAGWMADALKTFQKAAALDQDDPVIDRRIQQLDERLMRQRR